MFYSATGTMVLKSELLAMLNMYGSGELNEVTVFLPYFFGLPVMLPLKGKVLQNALC